MSKIVHTNKLGTERKRILRGIVVTLNALTKQSSFTEESWDMVAFIALSLRKVDATIEQATVAWEKRGYWIKADRYRLEWEWLSNSQKSLTEAAMEKDIDKAIQSIVVVADHLNNIKVSKNHRMGKPWVGAYQVLRKTNNK